MSLPSPALLPALPATVTHVSPPWKVLWRPLHLSPPQRSSAPIQPASHILKPRFDSIWHVHVLLCAWPCAKHLTDVRSLFLQRHPCGRQPFAGDNCLEAARLSSVERGRSINSSAAGPCRFPGALTSAAAATPEAGGDLGPRACPDCALRGPIPPQPELQVGSSWLLAQRPPSPFSLPEELFLSAFKCYPWLKAKVA